MQLQSSSKVKPFLPDYLRFTEIWSKWPLICSKCSAELPFLLKMGGGAISYIYKGYIGFQNHYNGENEFDAVIRVVATQKA